MTKTEIFESVNMVCLSSLEKEIQFLQEKNKIMKMIYSTSGFVNYYFENLKSYLSPECCFKYVNSLFEEFFGQKKFKSFKQFQSVVYGS
jgi:hypothetical protein